MENKICKNCKYFRLHYIKYSQGDYSALNYGHCVKPRMKKRDADTEACPYWERKEEPTMGIDSNLSDIYDMYCNSEEYQKCTKGLDFSPEWLKEKLSSKDYLKLENDVLHYVALSDRILFKAGFHYAWKIFHQCHSNKQT